MESKFNTILQDVDAVIARDPATKSRTEAILCSSGLHCIIIYRFSHWLWSKNFRLTARIVSQIARFLTGIEIHPGARIGKGFFIDHGMGVVIAKRHPTIGNNVIIGSGAQVLGPIKIGNNAKIGSNAIVVKEVPANTTVIGMAAHKVQELSRKEAQKFCAYGIDASHPDPMEERFEKLCRELENVKKELAELKKEKKNDAQ